MLLSWLISHLMLIAGFLLATLIIARIIQQRHSPSVTISWLLIIVLVPYIGVPLYLIFGGRKINRIIRSKANIKLLENETLTRNEASQIDLLLRSYGMPGATVGNSVNLNRMGVDGYRALVELIEQAAQSIYIATFVLHMDDVGKEIVRLLTRRASEGIDVRLLMDGVGSMFTTRRSLRQLVKAGGRIAYFMPVIHRPFHGWTNLRNHRKIVIVDQKRVMAGGTNIASEYIGPTPKPGRWRDLSFTLDGPAVVHYSQVFKSDWEYATGEHIELHPNMERQARGEGESAVVQIVPSGPDVFRDPLYYAIISAAFAAKQRIWVVTPYFVPDEALLQALVLAAHRGVDVRILVPEKSNHSIADLARSSYLQTIQLEGGKIQLFTEGMMHAKIMLMDNEMAMVGSANMDIRSLFLNFETAMFVYSKPEIQAIADYIVELASHSRAGVDKLGAFRSVFEGVARMLAPLL